MKLLFTVLLVLLLSGCANPRQRYSNTLSMTAATNECIKRPSLGPKRKLAQICKSDRNASQ